jgi:hypothetical protein
MFYNCCEGGRREKFSCWMHFSRRVRLAIHQPECPGHGSLEDWHLYQGLDGAIVYPAEEEAQWPMQLCEQYVAALAQDLHGEFSLEVALSKKRLAL